MFELKTRVLLVLVAGLGACSSATRPTTTAVTPAAPPVTTNAEAIARAREDSVRYPYVEADVRFMTNMIGHHAQAIKVAHMAATRGASAAVQRLADRIINAQQDEIIIMQQWLIDRQKPIPAVEGHAHHAHMPGMLTEEQLAQLEKARGAEFDRLFLVLMIQHHKGAVDMVKELLAVPGGAVDLLVFKLSSDIHVDQSTEIARMEQMLASLTNTQRN